MALFAFQTKTIEDIADATARALVSVSHFGDESFINLPMTYPGGSFVTVKLGRIPGGYRVSDNGFAYRELESIGMQRSFARTASGIAESEALEVNRRAVFVDVSEAEIGRAICDVGVASWRIANEVYSRASDMDEAEITDHLRDRLTTVFGESSLKPSPKLVGASTNEWELSAVVELPNRVAVFHAVSNQPNSIFKASTAFHDLAALEHPPILTAVVREKSEFGPRLALLSQAGRVIEEDQPDDVYLRAAA